MVNENPLEHLSPFQIGDVDEGLSSPVLLDKGDEPNRAVRVYRTRNMRRAENKACFYSRVFQVQSFKNMQVSLTKFTPAQALTHAVSTLGYDPRVHEEHGQTLAIRESQNG